MSETVAEFSPPSLTPQQEAQFHHDIDPWLDDMVSRHGMGGRMTKLPYDPGAYPFQGMGDAIIRARLPSAEDIASVGRENVRALASQKIKQKGHEGVGEENYEAMVHAMLEHDEGRTMTTILGLLAQPDTTVTELLAHANLQDIPFAQLVTLDALSQAALASDSGLDVLDIVDQSYSYVSETMTRLAWDGEPVIHILSGTANVVKVFPATERGTKIGIDRVIKQFINSRSRQALGAETARLLAKGRSRLDYMAPAGSSMDKVQEDGVLVGLKTKRINPVIGAQIAAESTGVWPVAIWFDGLADNIRVSWQLLELHKLNDRDEFNQTMGELNQATADLAGVPLVTSQPESERSHA